MADISFVTDFSTFKFEEVASNNGAIANGLTIKIANGTFAGDNGDSLLGDGLASVTGVPTGLTAVLVKTSATTAKLTFKGAVTAADDHKGDDDITYASDNLQVQFAAENFATGTMGNNVAITAKSLAMNFNDPVLVAEKKLTLVAPAGEGTTETYKAADLPTITGTAPDGVTKVYIYNNGGTKPIGEAAVSNNAWSFKLPTEKLKDGVYSLTASASNDGKGAMTAGFAFTVDTKAPAAPSVTAIKGAISDVTPVLTGKAEKFATVKVYSSETQNNTTLLGTTMANEKGVWTLAVTDASKLATDGNYKISALAIDAAGNETKSKTQTKDNLTIDTKIDTPTLTATIEAKKNTATLSGKVEGETGGTLQLYGGEDGSLALGKAIKIGKDGTWKSSVKLTDGKHLLSVVAVDAAGNVSDNSAVVAKTVDTFTATPTLELVKTGEVLTGLKGTAEAGATVKITIGAEKDKFTVTADADGKWVQSLAAFTPAKLGALKITAIATDTATNVSKPSTAVTHTFATATPDTTAPTFVSAATNADGTKVILTYSEALHATTAAKTAFAVDVGGSANTVTAVAVVGSTVELTLTTAITTGQVVKVGYTAPTAATGTANAAIQDAAGNDAVTLAATTAVTNAVGAVTEVDSVAVTSATQLTVTMTGTDALNAKVMDSGSTAIAPVAFSGTDTAVLTMTAQTTLVAAGTLVVTLADSSSVVPGAKVTLGTTGADAITVDGWSNVFTFGGADILKFVSADNLVVIADYTVADDSIQLSKAEFAALGAVGALSAGEFESGAGLVAAATADGRIVYDTTTGDLYYDADGSVVAVAPVLVGTFTGAPALVVGEFEIVA